MYYDFLVEDGAGIEGATSYATVAQADEYATFFKYPDWELLDEADKEPLLMRASTLLDEQFTWRSHILSQKQGLLFPRHPFLDSEGRMVTGVPKALIDAACEIAILLESHSETDITQGVKSLSSQSYGTSKETYSTPWTESSSIFYTKFSQIAERLKKFGYGGKGFTQVRLSRG